MAEPTTADLIAFLRDSHAIDTVIVDGHETTRCQKCETEWPCTTRQAADRLAELEAEVERLRGVIEALVNPDNDSQMSTPLGLVPLNSTGMRQVVDALAGERAMADELAEALRWWYVRHPALARHAEARK